MFEMITLELEDWSVGGRSRREVGCGHTRAAGRIRILTVLVDTGTYTGDTILWNLMHRSEYKQNWKCEKDQWIMSML